jgi:hypothetical protein
MQTADNTGHFSAEHAEMGFLGILPVGKKKKQTH